VVVTLRTISRVQLRERGHSTVTANAAEQIDVRKEVALGDFDAAGLHVRFERLAFIHEAFMKIARCIICWLQLHPSLC
jgi:hypothetical protein